ncbi:unnamed protein product [Rhizoctonia solani]|nr:unnamed protein product [Rhizoctonia solani]
MAIVSYPVVRAADSSFILNAGTTRPSNASLPQVDPLSGSTNVLARAALIASIVVDASLWYKELPPLRP